MASLFSKPNTIVYVRRSGLIVAGRQVKPARLNFPTGVITNLEIVQHAKFIRGCQAFFTDQHVKGKRVLIVLDQSLVFEKTIPAADNQTLDNGIDAYVAAIPFSPGKRAYIQLRRDEALQLYATNYEIYTGIAQALEAAGVSKIIAITPAAAYGLSPEQKLASAIERFITDTMIHRAASFKQVQPL